jgi:hypothetical protein
MTVDLLADAVVRALDVRGTVMFGVPRDPSLWCAVFAAVDGSLELRVGEPKRGWRSWRPTDGETWLRDRGFVHGLDAWSLPVPHGSGPRMCAETMWAALEHGLGVRRDTVLNEVLVHPGVIGEVPPPPPDAPHRDHIRAALRSLALRRHGKFDISGGRPAKTWGFVFVDGEELELSPEPLVMDPEYPYDWRVPLSEPDAVAAADRMVAVIYDEIGRDPHAPLFIAFMDVG